MKITYSSAFEDEWRLRQQHFSAQEDVRLASHESDHREIRILRESRLPRDGICTLTLVLEHWCEREYVQLRSVWMWVMIVVT